MGRRGAMTDGSARLVFVAANPSIDRLHEVDAIEAGAIHRPDLVVPVPGGKGLNAARAAAALGGSVVAIALLGGHAGAWIEERLAELGVATRTIPVDGETRTCISVLDRSTGQLTEFYEPGPPISTTAFAQLEAAVEEELATGSVRVLAMSGSLPSGVSRDGYGRLVSMARDRGITTIIDSHGEALGAALDAGPTVVKVNASEAAEVTRLEVGGRSSAIDAAEAIRRAGAAGVVVTLGRDGAVMCDDLGRWGLTSESAPGRYPVGSGDAFLGGLAVALAAGEDLVAAATLGMAAAIANADLPGAGILDVVKVDRVRPAIEVQRL
jgi:1-phosphofructokinase family hexose kinase